MVRQSALPTSATTQAWSPPPPHSDRGWVWLYTEHVQQADVGADLDFLAGGSGDPVPRQPF